MKIILISLPNTTKELHSNVKIGWAMYPYSIVYLSSYLFKHGYKAEIWDLADTATYTELIAYLGKTKPEIVGFTASSENRFIVIDAIKELRDLLPDTKIILGGKHFTFTYEEAIQEIPELDVLVRGEGEITLLELVKAFDAGKSIETIKGISFSANGRTIHNPERPVEMDINKFEISDEVLPKGTYSAFMLMRNYEEYSIEAIPLLLGRGCPQKCVYCIHRLQKYRVRSLDNVIRSVIEKKERYGKEYFCFTDPSFTERKKFIHSFCRELINRGIKIKWWCEARADTDLDQLKMMKKAGCISLDFALESGSEKVLKTIRKKINLNHVLAMAKNCNNIGIRSLVFTMVSLPGETCEDTKSTLKFVKEISPYVRSVVSSVSHIYPGTELEKIARERNAIPGNFSWYDKAYKNSCPDLVPETIPPYFELLTPEWVRNNYMKEFTSLYAVNFVPNKLLISKIVKNIKPLLFDWKKQNMTYKKSMIKLGSQFVTAKIKSAVKR